MADGMQITSRDLERVRMLHKQFPYLIEKTFPATAREETKPFARGIRQGVKIWPKDFRIQGSAPIDLTKVATRKFRGRGELGISIRPKAMGPSVLFELGSKGVRHTKTGRSTGIMPAKPVYSIQWDIFKASGKNTIQTSFVKATISAINRELRKRGLK